MRWKHLLFFSSLAIACGACGGAQDSPLLDGGLGTDDGGADASTDAVTNCSITCATIPDGFTPISLPDGKAPCPDGWGSTSVVSAPTAGDGTCSCSCNVTAQPDCNTGSVTRTYDDTTSASCGTTASTFPANNGACSPIGGYLLLNHAHYATTAPDPTGGTCEFDSKTDTTKVTTTPTLLCAPPSSCLGAICNGGSVCVSKGGDIQCPSGFPNKTLVGASATATCSACTATCAVTGQCTGTLSFYTEGTCTTTGTSFTADGTCDTNPSSSNVYYDYYSYTGSVASAACGGPPPTSTATPSLDSPTTVCCQQH